MSAPEPANALAAYSVLLLVHGDAALLLRRAVTKRFAPGRWTGLGGRVEPAELDDLRAAALRELAEETGITPDEVEHLALRRVLLVARPGEPLEVLLYLTGTLDRPRLPASPEGTLAWVPLDDIARLDVIDNTAQVIPALLADMRRDPAGREPPHPGAARYRADGALERIVWA